MRMDLCFAVGEARLERLPTHRWRCLAWPSVALLATAYRPAAALGCHRRQRRLHRHKEGKCSERVFRHETAPIRYRPGHVLVNRCTWIRRAGCPMPRNGFSSTDRFASRTEQTFACSVHETCAGLVRGCGAKSTRKHGSTKGTPTAPMRSHCTKTVL